MILDTNALSAAADREPAALELVARAERIAALCLQHSLPVLSRDRHFDFVPGLRRLYW